MIQVLHFVLALNRVRQGMPEIKNFAKVLFFFILLYYRALYFKRFFNYCINIFLNIALFKELKQLFIACQRHFNRLCKSV